MDKNQHDKAEDLTCKCQIIIRALRITDADRFVIKVKEKGKIKPV
jgi:hypothetical protein